MLQLLKRCIAREKVDVLVREAPTAVQFSNMRFERERPHLAEPHIVVIFDKNAIAQIPFNAMAEIPWKIQILESQ